MTTDERIARLERAFATLADVVTRNYPLRGAPADVRAAQDIHAEVRALNDAEAASKRRLQLEAELAGLDAA